MDSDLTSLCTRKKRKKAQNTLFWRKVRARDAKLGAGVVCVEYECLVELVAASWLSRNWQNEKTDSHRIDAMAGPLCTCKLAYLIPACQHACFGGEPLFLVVENKG